MSKECPTYGERNESLKTLGFESYEAYLESSTWKELRKLVWERDKYRCIVCRRKASLVHHISYHMTIMTAAKPVAYLVSMCRKCHDFVHFDGETTQTLKQARTRLRKLFDDRNNVKRRQAHDNKPKQASSRKRQKISKSSGRHYRDRDARLKQLGYRSYSHYLESEPWNSLRLLVLKRDNHKCRCCNATATSVHHISYAKAVLTAKRPNRSLVSICGQCHKAIHVRTPTKRRPRGKKTSLEFANQKLFKLCRKNHANLPGRCSKCKQQPTKKGQKICRQCKKRLT